MQGRNPFEYLADLVTVSFGNHSLPAIIPEPTPLLALSPAALRRRNSYIVRYRPVNSYDYSCALAPDLFLA